MSTIFNGRFKAELERHHEIAHKDVMQAIEATRREWLRLSRRVGRRAMKARARANSGSASNACLDADLQSGRGIRIAWDRPGTPVPSQGLSVRRAEFLSDFAGTLPKDCPRLPEDYMWAILEAYRAMYDTIDTLCRRQPSPPERASGPIRESNTGLRIGMNLLRRAAWQLEAEIRRTTDSKGAGRSHGKSTATARRAKAKRRAS